MLATASVVWGPCRLRTGGVRSFELPLCAGAALGPVALAAHTIVKQIVDFAMAIFGTFSTVAQSLIATCLGKVPHHLSR